MRTTGAKAVSVPGIFLIALLASCSKGNTASTDPVTSSQNLQVPIVTPAAVVTGADGIAIDNYSLVSSTRISRTVYEYTYTADVSNWGSGDAAITATLASTVPEITVMEGTLDFGDVTLGATQVSTDTFTIRVDRSLPFNEDALVWTAQATPLPPTTFQLIDQALANGTLDAETALVYKVFFEFNDSRLPTQYQGRDNQFFEATAIKEAARQFNTLSSATQQILAPFLQLPDFSNIQVTDNPPAVQAASLSTAASSSDIHVMQVVPDTVYIEWQDDPDASAESDMLNAAGRDNYEIFTNIWPKLTGLFGAPPAGKKIIIWLDPVIKRSVTTTEDCVDELIRLAEKSTQTKTNQTLAHELTHALQDMNFLEPKCNAAEPLWLGEATATWAQHFVYPAGNSGGEQDTAPWFLNRPAESLETYDGSISNDPHQYGAYLWFLYMTQGASATSGNASYVRQVWNAVSTFDSLNALDIAIPDQGGLTKKWHDFVLYNWNRDPQDNKPYRYYWQWDKLKTKARELQGSPIPVRANLDGAVAKTYPLYHNVPHLAATYYDFDFTKDNTIRRIRLVQPYSSDSTGKVKVQVIAKIRNKGWQQAQDWTSFRQKTLCRDKPEEDFERVVIVFSNSEFDDTSFVMQDDGTHTKLQVSALGCSNWKGSVQGRFDDTDPADLITATTDAQNVTFEKYSDVWTDTNNYQAFKVTGGTVKWTFSETQNIGVTCTGNFGGTYSLANTTFAEAELDLGVNPPSGGSEQPDYYINAGMLPVSGGGSWTVSPTDYYLTCPSLPGYKSPTILVGEVARWFSVADEKKENLPGIYDFTVTDSSGAISNYTLEGSTIFVLIADPNKHYTYTWTLEQNGTFASDP